jgi:predicted amidohydrolase
MKISWSKNDLSSDLTLVDDQRTVCSLEELQTQHDRLTAIYFVESVSTSEVCRSIALVHRHRIVAHIRIGCRDDRWDGVLSCYDTPFGRIALFSESQRVRLDVLLVELDPFLIITHGNVGVAKNNNVVQFVAIDAKDKNSIDIQPKPRPNLKCFALIASSSSTTVRVAAVQAFSRMGEVEFNRQHLATLVREAAAGGAKIIVLPETAVTGYLSQDLETNWRVNGRPLDRMFKTGRDPAPCAEPIPGASTELFCCLAHELRVYVAVPLLEVDDHGHYYNSIALCSPAGEIAAHYRKNTPWPVPEKSWADACPQKKLASFDTEYGVVGLAICFDIHETVPRYKSEGKNLWTLLYPIAWVDGTPLEHWFHDTLPLARVKAADLGFNVIGANW